MQVNTGSAKGRRLKSVPGDAIRPITDRAKQALFNILMDDVRGSRWLDLFAGTGAVAIEALSRGAEHATLIDIAPQAIQVIRENLRITRLESKARVIRQDAFDYLQARPNARYDYIFVAPPQYQGLWSRALIAIDENIGWLSESGTVIVQIDPREYFPIALDHLELGDQRRYGKTMLLFYDRL
ncbi:MAG: RNA methyltransferase [Candidatus Roseilinea sp.]|nr:MAG: RNA methyltransferase [Candidatus Roseilinea sp.]